MMDTSRIYMSSTYEAGRLKSRHIRFSYDARYNYTDLSGFDPNIIYAC